MEEQMIGDYNPDNLKRLKMAVLILMEGVSPLNRDFLSKETAQHFDLLERHIKGESTEDFYVLREHYIAFIISSQRDEGVRSANIPQATS